MAKHCHQSWNFTFLKNVDMVTMEKRETFQDLEFLVTLLSKNIWFISSIIVLSWDVVQWRGIGKTKKKYLK